MTLRSRSRSLVTIGVPTAGSTNAYGDVEDVYTETEVSVWLSPTGSSEDNIDRETRTRTWKVLIDAAVADALPLTGDCTVTIDGSTCRILGEPELYSGHRGAHHYEFTAEEVLG